MSKKLSRKFVVTVRGLNHISSPELREYIDDAVKMWGGQDRPPGVDPEFPDGGEWWQIMKSKPTVTYLSTRIQRLMQRARGEV